ncbi:MAG: glutamine--fructose-6-phosphate transaminase (isomerizing) [Deltaproteobacteria bacterium]|nr:MAG: glutamine--fructose-6-phosphate transaminase (isomerizing) [Deltaproteobacteria bacterium]
MCGIVGYVGNRNALEVIMNGLKRLEYRGYDSAGLAIFSKGKLSIVRAEGKIENLEKQLEGKDFKGKVGIGHTRWATHGRPSERNAHPHLDGTVAVVHNGIIENYVYLKKMLEKKNHTFRSETDTEVISHLINQYIIDGNSFEDAVRRSLKMLEGSYAVGIICEQFPGILIAARKESPMIVGLGEGEYFIASDIPAILNYTRKMIFLEDGDMVVLSDKEPVIFTLKGKRVTREAKIISWDPVMAEKEGYKHFMLKEIFEQPRAIVDTIRGRIIESKSDIFLEQINLSLEEIDQIERINIVACGTSWHAGLVGKFMIEGLCRIPVDVDLGSEFRYRDPLVDERTLLILISQSGETADTLAALKEGKHKGAKLLSICNVMDSSLVRGSDGVIYTRAGPEIGVASTKAFTTQLVILYLLSLYLGKKRKALTSEDLQGLIDDLLKIAHQAELILNQEEKIKNIARQFVSYNNFLYLGRGINFPIALEGALKLKEISYIHAEGYPGGEMKHGPIALIDENTPTVALITRGITYEKMLANIEEVKAREGKVIAVTSPSDRVVKKKVDEIIAIPSSNHYLTPILLTIPLQLFAYHVAVFRGTDVDQPRNLAKSVTVE